MIVVNPQVLFCSRNPMKLSLFCLGSTAAAVMVGSAGTALESAHKAEAEIASVCNRLNIIATDLKLPAQKWCRRLRGYRVEEQAMSGEKEKPL
jgi:hypothetical protein